MKSAEDYFEERGAIVTNNKRKFGYMELESNCIVQLNIKQANPDETLYETALNYYFLKLTKSPQMAVFLDSITEIKITKKIADHCKLAFVTKKIRWCLERFSFWAEYK